MKSLFTKPNIIAVLLGGALIVWVLSAGGGSSAPFKADKPYALIVEETKERHSYTADQRAAILGVLKETMKARGGDAIILDKDQNDLSNVDPWVDAAFKVPRTSLPWIVAAGPGGRGTSEALPPTLPEILAAAEKAR